MCLRPQKERETDLTASFSISSMEGGSSHNYEIPKAGEVLMCSDTGDFAGILTWTVKFGGDDTVTAGVSLLKTGQIDLLKLTGVPPACNPNCYEETTLQAASTTGGPPTPLPQYPLPPGKGGLVVRNFYGQDMTFTVNKQQYTVPSNGEQFIVLDPGDYPWSAFIPGQGQAHGSATIAEGRIFIQSFASR